VADLRFNDPYGPSSEDSVAATEAAISTPLPQGYREYLLNNGGGHDPELRYFRARWGAQYRGTFGPGANAEDWVYVTTFLRPASQHDPSSLATVYARSRSALERLPMRLLPVATSSSGGYVCLDIDGPEVGAVRFFYDQDLEGKPADASILARVASSFTAWLDACVGNEGVPEKYRF